MLPAGLVRARVVQRQISPSLVDPDQPKIRATADQIHQLYTSAVAQGRRLGEVSADLEDLCAERRDHRMVRGMAHLARQRTTLETATDLDPIALRDEVFAEAARAGPLALSDDPLAGADGDLARPTADQVLAEVAARHDVAPEIIANALYADLETERRITAVALPSPAWLVDRYNIALVQGLLRRASAVEVQLTGTTAPRMKQLFRWIKFHQLLHRSTRSRTGLSIHLDGPMSLFAGSTRYGRNLARFFPALCLQPTWQLDATVLWTKANHEKQLVMTHEAGLRSHYADTGAYQTRTVEHFVARFAEAKTAWTMTEGREPIQLGPSEVVFPDFTFTDGARVAHLEIWGHWRPEALDARLAGIARYGPVPLALAVSKRLASGSAKVLPEHAALMSFAEVLAPKRVLEVVERVATAVPPPP